MDLVDEQELMENITGVALTKHKLLRFIKLRKPSELGRHVGNRLLEVWLTRFTNTRALLGPKNVFEIRL